MPTVCLACIHVFWHVFHKGVRRTLTTNQGVDPEVYLRDVIEWLPHIKANDLEALDALTPHIWARDYRKKQAEDDPHTAAA